LGKALPVFCKKKKGNEKKGNEKKLKNKQING
jgi:hypothetical protein